MRILIVTPYLPWPLNTGGNAAQFHTLRCLACDHRFTLVCPVSGDTGRQRAVQLEKELPGVTVRAVPCGNRPPRTRVQRAVARALRLTESVFIPRTQQRSLPDFPFSPLPVPLVEAVSDEIDRGTDLLQAEFAPTLSLGPWCPPELPRLFVHHQLHFVYAARFAAAHGRTAASEYLQSMMRLQELACLRHFDAVITFSPQDREALLPHLDPETVFTSPFPMVSDLENPGQIPREFDGRFIFVGSGVHDPNVDALEWTLSRIWPAILRRLPSARLVIVGDWRPHLRKRYAAEGVVFAGFIDDLAAELRGGILLAPLRIGSGIRAKLLFALARGIPVVSTPVGAEGLMVEDGVDLLVRSGPEAFANAAAKLATDPELRQRLSLSALDTIAGHYSPRRVRETRNAVYGRILDARSAPGAGLRSSASAA